MKVVRAMWRGLPPHLKGKLVAGEELTAEEVGVVRALLPAPAEGVQGPGQAQESAAEGGPAADGGSTA